MRALVPVSVRTEDERGTAGNRIVVMRGPLPVYIADPLQPPALRLARDGRPEGVQAGPRRRGDLRRAELRAADDPRPGLAAELLDAAVQSDRDERPRPAVPAVRARPRDGAAIPVAFLPENHALAIAIMSYNGQMNFGLLGDFDALHDIDALGESIRGELSGLVEQARETATAAV